MKNQKNPLGRKDEIVVQEMDGEVLIYDLKDDKAFCLNETSSLIWQMCDGNNSVSEISKRVSKKLNSPVSEDLVWLAIEQLKKEKLIANSKDLPNNFEGMNRREVIKKVGLASMIALPVVAGLVAPTAAHAASPTACANPPGQTPTFTPCSQSCQCNQNGNPGSVCCANVAGFGNICTANSQGTVCI